MTVACTAPSQFPNDRRHCPALLGRYRLRFIILVGCSPCLWGRNLVSTASSVRALPPVNAWPPKRLLVKSVVRSTVPSGLMSLSPDALVVVSNGGSLANPTSLLSENAVSIPTFTPGFQSRKLQACVCGSHTPVSRCQPDPQARWGPPQGHWLGSSRLALCRASATPFSHIARMEVTVTLQLLPQLSRLSAICSRSLTAFSSSCISINVTGWLAGTVVDVLNASVLHLEVTIFLHAVFGKAPLQTPHGRDSVVPTWVLQYSAVLQD